jgi:tetratricopeptide (TPR) repeat protein
VSFFIVTPPDDPPPLDHERVQELLWQALREPTESRERWLAAQDATEAERDEARSLITHHEHAGTRFDHPVLTRPTEAGERLLGLAAGELPERIGGYRIVRRLGTGGMGSVYEAEQEHPSRPVALKVMDRGLSSPTARRRFAFESEALARLRHPAIAQVYEAVAPDEGALAAPWFAMEYVPDARSIDEWAEGRDRDQRLALFADVCDAVHHGHQRGVIHRDLKPANILVTAEDQPKVIDFGVARLVDPTGEGQGGTIAGQLVGTLGNMAPEQIVGNPEEVDTRADVYALGTVLYELLTGRPPFVLEGLTFTQAIQAVTRAEPPRPSAVARGLSRDLDAIVRTAMAADIDRRYNSASALAADVRRVLDKLPISARPPSLGYVLAQFARRNKVAVAAAAVVLVALVASTSVSLGFATTAEAKAKEADHARGQEATARADAEAARDEEQHQRELADAASESARREATRLDAVIRFLMKGVFTRPFELYESRARSITIDEAVDIAAEDLTSIADPWAEAEVRSLLGHVYFQLGRPRDAVQQFRRAQDLHLALDDGGDEEWLAMLAGLADAERFAGDPQAARELHDTILTWIEAMGGTGSPAHGDALARQAALLRDLGDLDGALEGYAEAVTILESTRGPEHAETLEARVGLATLHRVRGEPGQAAEQLPELILALMELSPQPGELIVVASTELGTAYVMLGRLGEAEPLLEQALASRRQIYEPGHPAVATGLVALGSVHHTRGDFGRAAELYGEAADIYRERLGESQVFLPITLWNRGSALLSAGRLDEAIVALDESLDGFRALGRAGRDTAPIVDALAEAHMRAGRPQGAVTAFRDALEAVQATGTSPELVALYQGRLDSLEPGS